MSETYKHGLKDICVTFHAHHHVKQLLCTNNIVSYKIVLPRYTVPPESGQIPVENTSLGKRHPSTRRGVEITVTLLHPPQWRASPVSVRARTMDHEHRMEEILMGVSGDMIYE